MDQLHRQELALAAKKAKEELAADNLSLKYDPTQGIPEPVAGPAGGGQAGFPPDVADVIAPGLPREELFRQQRYIEELILLRQHRHNQGPAYQLHHHHPAHQQVPFGPHHHHHHQQAQVVDMQHMMLRMREILRMREEGRQQQRLARQAELAALRDLGAQPWLPQPQQPPAAAAAAPAPGPPLPPPHVHMDVNRAYLNHGPPAPPPAHHQHLFGYRPIPAPLHFHRYGAEPPVEVGIPHHHHHHQFLRRANGPQQHPPLPPVHVPQLPPHQLHPGQHQLQPMIAVPPMLIAQPPGPERIPGPPHQQPQPLEAADHEVNRHLRQLWDQDQDRRRMRRGGPPDQQQQRLEGEVNVERVPNNFGMARK